MSTTTDTGETTPLANSWRYLVGVGVVVSVLGVLAVVFPLVTGLALSAFLGALLAVGVLLFVGFPSTAAWAVSLLFGINPLSSGLSMALFGLNGRKAARG